MKINRKVLPIFLCIVLLIGMCPFSALAADNQCPLINPITSSAGTTFAEGTSTTFKTRASDNIALKEIDLFIDNKLERVLVITADGVTSQEYSYNTSTLSVGTHTIKIVVYDTSGNKNETELNVTVTDANPPVIKYIRSSAGDSFPEGTTTKISMKATDSVGIEKIILYIDGSKINTWYGDDDTSLIASYSTSDLEEGSHTIKVVAYDLSGNKSSDSMTITVSKVEDTEPPVIVSLSSSAGDSFPEGTTTKISMKATDSVGIEKITL